MKFHRIGAGAALVFALVLGAAEGISQTWVRSSAPDLLSWTGLASSADGRTLFGANFYRGPAPHYLEYNLFSSTNWGAAWSSNNVEWLRYPTEMTCSADGNSIALIKWSYGDMPDGEIATSMDGGLSWRSQILPEGGAYVTDYSIWYSVACSADGRSLAALAREDLLFGLRPSLLVSRDFGMTWTSTNRAISWTAVALSGDGSRLVGTSADNIYTSVDWGATWTATSPPTHPWTAVTCSGDGSRIVAVASDGAICSSANHGASWACSNLPFGLCDVASSAEGTTLLVAPGYTQDPVYLSRDGGVSWEAAGLPLDNWCHVTSSADGNKLAAAGKAIYTLEAIPRPELTIGGSSTIILLSWIVPSMPFVLQQNASLADVGWTDVAVQATLNFTNLKYEVGLQPEGGHRFYRLTSR